MNTETWDKFSKAMVRLLIISAIAEKTTASQGQAVNQQRALAECPLSAKGLFVPSLKRDIVLSIA